LNVFLSHPSVHDIAEIFLASLALTRVAKNPLIEVISLLVPMGPPIILLVPTNAAVAASFINHDNGPSTGEEIDEIKK
jgi:energy-coupling factor transporter transmembrane protein EcfT